MELYHLYSSSSIIRVIKSRRMRWVGYAERMEERIDAYRFLLGKTEGNRPLGRFNVNGSVILKWILKKWVREVDWIDPAEDGDSL